MFRAFFLKMLYDLWSHKSASGSTSREFSAHLLAIRGFRNVRSAGDCQEPWHLKMAVGPGTYMAADSSAWWPGGLTTANPFWKHKTGFSGAGVVILIRSLQLSITDTQEEAWRLSDTPKHISLSLPPCHSIKRNTWVTFAQILSQTGPRWSRRTERWDLFIAVRQSSQLLNSHNSFARITFKFLTSTS